MEIILIWEGQGDLSYGIKKTTAGIFQSASLHGVRLIRFQDFLECALLVKKTSEHPTEKPLELYRFLLTNYAKPGQTILDTHGGSMSIALACWDLGFDLTVCELDKDYFDSAVKRIEKHVSQGRLFEPEQLQQTQENLV